MARTAIEKCTVTATGYNLTDSADFEVMATGAGNGVQFAYGGNDLIVFKNGTGGAAVYTCKVPQPDEYVALGVTVPDVTVTVAAAKSWFYRPPAVMAQSDGLILVDCDVAASIMVMAEA